MRPDLRDFEASLGYIAISRLTLATEPDPVSKAKIKTIIHKK